MILHLKEWKPTSLKRLPDYREPSREGLEPPHRFPSLRIMRSRRISHTAHYAPNVG